MFSLKKKAKSGSHRGIYNGSESTLKYAIELPQNVNEFSVKKASKVISNFTTRRLKAPNYHENDSL